MYFFHIEGNFFKRDLFKKHIYFKVKIYKRILDFSKLRPSLMELVWQNIRKKCEYANIFTHSHFNEYIRYSQIFAFEQGHANFEYHFVCECPALTCTQPSSFYWFSPLNLYLKISVKTEKNCKNRKCPLKNTKLLKIK